MHKPEMQYTKLGRSGTEVSKLCFGTYTMLHKTDPLDGMKLIGKAWGYGINFIDTSDNYGTEMLVGRAIKENRIPRDKMVIATKTGIPRNEYERDLFGLMKIEYDTSAARIKRQAESSIKVMESDYIDLYQTHVYDEKTQLSDVVQAMNELVEEGKIRHYGFSNYSLENTERAIESCKEEKLKHYPVSVQPYYNLSAVGNDGVVDFAKKSGMSVLAHRPLASGYFVESSIKNNYRMQELDNAFEKMKGKVSGEDLESLKKKIGGLKKEQRIKSEFRRLQDAAQLKVRNIQQLSIAWLLSRGVIPIMGANKEIYLKEYIAALDWELDDRTLDQIGEVRKNVAAIEKEK